MCHVAEKPAGGVSPPVLFNPLHGEIDNIPLIHLPDGGVAKLNGGNGMRFFKILADFFKIFAVYEQRFVCLPDSFAVFKHGTVFYAGVLSGISCTHIC